jgi:hypothetical protein
MFNTRQNNKMVECYQDLSGIVHYRKNSYYSKNYATRHDLVSRRAPA